MPRKITKRLFDACPEAKDYWDRERNQSIDADSLGPNSEKLVWWMCANNHHFQVTPKDFTKRTTGKCLECKTIGFLYPDLCKEIDSSKHSDIDDLLKISAGSTRKIWWICPKGHEYEAQIYSRAKRGTGCDICSKSKTSKQEIRILCELRKVFENVQYRTKIRKKEVDIYLADYKIGVEFDGSYWHRGKEAKDAKKNKSLLDAGVILIRIREEPLRKISDHDILTSGIRKKISKDDMNELMTYIRRRCDHEIATRIDDYISKKNFQAEKEYKHFLAEMPVPYETSIANRFPGLVAEWHPTKNHPLTPSMLTPSSTTPVWWQCKNGHVWQRTPDQRTQTGKIVGNCQECISIRFLRPDLVELISSKNTDKGIAEKSLQCPEVVWWECKNGHSFQREIRLAAGYSQRKRKKELYCVTCQSLGFKFPELLKEFDYNRNKDIDPMITSWTSMHFNAWWKCKNGHEWQQLIGNRTKYYPNPKAECLSCRSIAFNRPDLMKEWHPTKNKGVDPFSIGVSSDKLIWWQCKNNHEWSTTAYARCRTDYPDPPGKTKGYCKDCP